MSGSQQLPLVGFLLFFLFPVQHCEICEADQASLTPLKHAMINSDLHYPIPNANILIALKLSRQHDSKNEMYFLKQVEEDVKKHGDSFTSGQLALNIMALRAACQNRTIDDLHLVRKLEEKFQEELKSISTSGHPLTNNYKLGLDVLALCLLNGKYSASRIAELFSPENMTYFFGGRFSVDTGALAVLALTCVNRKNPNEKISNNISWLVKEILEQKNGDGIIGNFYSTGEAMQALFVSSEYYQSGSWNCNKTLQAVINHIPQNVFKLPISAAQVLPALEGKTYLDITQVSCQSSPDHLETPIPKPGESTQHSKENISVTYRVVDTINNTIDESIMISVPKGSVFLKVMEAAQAENYSIFRFTTVLSFWGPYIQSIHGIESSNKDRTYWELLDNGQQLNQGAGNFVVSNGDHLEARLTKF